MHIQMVFERYSNDVRFCLLIGSFVAIFNKIGLLPLSVQVVLYKWRYINQIIIIIRPIIITFIGGAENDGHENAGHEIAGQKI